MSPARFIVLAGPHPILFGDREKLDEWVHNALAEGGRFRIFAIKGELEAFHRIDLRPVAEAHPLDAVFDDILNQTKQPPTERPTP